MQPHNTLINTPFKFCLLLLSLARHARAALSLLLRLQPNTGRLHCLECTCAAAVAAAAA